MVRLGGRAWTWLWYLPSTVAAILFICIALVTFGDLAQVQYDAAAGSPGSQLNGVMAATFITPVVTAALVLMSFFVLVKKSWSRSGSGFSYGFCTATFLLNSQLLLITGIELTANKHYTAGWEAAGSGVWAHSATNAMVASYVLAFICACFFMVTGVALISNRRSFGAGQMTVDELGLSDRLRSPASPGSAPVTGAPAPPYPASEMASRSLPGARASAGAWNV